MSTNKKGLASLALIVIVGSGLVIGFFVFDIRGHKGQKQNTQTQVQQKQSSYSLDIKSGLSYPSAPLNKMTFNIKDGSGSTLNNYDQSETKPVEVTFARKDLATITHEHPVYDATTSSFTVDKISLSGDAPYRMYVEFTPKDAERDDLGNSKTVVVSQDIEVGDQSGYVAQQPAQELERPTTMSDSYALGIVQGGNDGVDIGYVAGATTRIAISVEKSKVPVKNIDNFFGTLGHIVVIDEKLNYIKVNNASEYTEEQFGNIQFDVMFPSAAKYKIHIQTKANGEIIEGDLVVKSNPDSSGNTKKVENN